MQPHGSEHLKVLLRASAIQKRVREMGLQISKDYSGQRVHLIGVLKGAAIFLSDLARQIRVEVSLDFIAVSSYGHGRESSGQVRLTKDLDTSIEGLNVIVIETSSTADSRWTICCARYASANPSPCTSPHCSISRSAESTR